MNCEVKLTKQKKRKRAAPFYQEKDYFARVAGNCLQLSSAVRDYILPRRNVMIHAYPDKLAITPTDDASEYCVSVSARGQAKITYIAARHFTSLPEDRRIPAQIQKDGSIWLPVGQLEATP